MIDLDLPAPVSRMLYQKILERAARAIESAHALLIGAGAGMGVDSGLPDFRGDNGFWKAYPPLRGRTFYEVANPRLFLDDPCQAWGFYGHRMNLYRDTTPHEGFNVLASWVDGLAAEHFVYTSNVDGHFQRAGFAAERVVECHGSINFLQCSAPCTRDIWSADGTRVAIDESSFRAGSALPVCRQCHCVARPNILMFGDFAWIPERTARQEDNYERWLQSTDREKLVAIEFGAGTAVPTVRFECGRRAGKLIRVNPRDFEAGEDAISIPLTALETIRRIDQLLTGAGAT